MKLWKTKHVPLGKSRQSFEKFFIELAIINDNPSTVRNIESSNKVWLSHNAILARLKNWYGRGSQRTYLDNAKLKLMPRIIDRMLEDDYDVSRIQKELSFYFKNEWQVIQYIENLYGNSYDEVMLMYRSHLL